MRQGFTAVHDEKPVVVYLHRYPPEIEAQQWPALVSLADALAPRYELVYCCMGPSDGVRNETIRRKMRVIELPFTVDQASGRDKWLKTWRWYRHLGRLVSCIREVGAAAVICKEMLPFIPGRIAKLGIPTIIETGDWWWTILLGGTLPGRWLAERLEAWEVRGWNRPHVRAVVVTNADGRMLEGRGLPKDRIVRVNNPRNTINFGPLDPRPSKAELGLREEHTHVAVFGIIRQGKGYDQLLDWWKIAVARHPDWRLVIIGGAGGETWCQREIAKRELESHVLMTGWLATKDDLNRWLNAMDVLLALRRNSADNQGIIPSAVPTGLTTGRPLVATGLPGIAEIIRDGIDGFLFKPDDRESFIGAIERAVSDPALAARVGLSGMARAAERFDPRRAADTYVSLIDAITGHCAAAPSQGTAVDPGTDAATGQA